MSSSEPDSVGINREVWTRSNERWGDAHALDQWRAAEITWGTWNVPEAECTAAASGRSDVVGSGAGVFLGLARTPVRRPVGSINRRRARLPARCCLRPGRFH
jgi:hypothetical protein